MQSATERRQNILEFLSVNRTTTLTEIMSRFGISRRTAIRDIELLSCSAPIFTSQGNGGGIKVAEGWYLSKVYLSEQQENLLNGLLPSLSGADEITMREILMKFSKPKA